MTTLDNLKAIALRASGADAAMDAAITATFGVPPGDYTASVEKCRTLAAAVLPGWRLHVGYGASGIFPYAAFRDGTRQSLAEAPTLPLAILRALLGTFDEGAADRSGAGLPAGAAGQ